jgi:hypothetical protein
MALASSVRFRFLAALLMGLLMGLLMAFLASTTSLLLPVGVPKTRRLYGFELGPDDSTSVAEQEMERRIQLLGRLLGQMNLQVIQQRLSCGAPALLSRVIFHTLVHRAPDQH